MHEAREERCAAREGPAVKSMVSAGVSSARNPHATERAQPDIRFEPGRRATKKNPKTAGFAISPLRRKYSSRSHIGCEIFDIHSSFHRY